MKIINATKYSSEILIEKLKRITMLKNEYVYIYKDTFISIEKINPDLLHPTQNYILNYELENKIELFYALKDLNINMFDIDGYIEFQIEGENFSRTLLPPIIEECIERNGLLIPIINDGMHRIFISRMYNIIPSVVYVRGIPKKYPYYAYPLKNSWNDVQRINNIQDGFIKKWHRIKYNKQLYRNFNSVFSNCSAPRKK